MPQGNRDPGRVCAGFAADRAAHNTITDTDDVAYRAVLVSTTPRGVDGYHGATSWHTVYCTLGRAGNGWLITGYQVDGG